MALSHTLRSAQGDIILVGLRDFQDDKADVILKYSADEARNLKVCAGMMWRELRTRCACRRGDSRRVVMPVAAQALGELPDTVMINEGTADGKEGEDGAGDAGFEFVDVADI